MEMRKYIFISIIIVFLTFKDQCGNYFDGFVPFIPNHFFQPVPHHQFRTENAVPHRCAVRKVVRNCPPLQKIYTISTCHTVRNS